MLRTTIGRLRAIAFIEGVSFLVLLFIAMPLKYWAGIPSAVRVVGMTHGVLFLVFTYALMETSIVERWRPTRWGPVFLSSLVPFGTFVADRYLVRWSESRVAA